MQKQICFSDNPKYELLLIVGQHTSILTRFQMIPIRVTMVMTHGYIVWPSLFRFVFICLKFSTFVLVWFFPFYLARLQFSILTSSRFHCIFKILSILYLFIFNPRALWAPASFLQEGRNRTTNMGAPPHCSSPI